MLAAYDPRMARRADELGDRRALVVLSAALGVVVGLIVGALAVALLGDALFHALWQRSGLGADDIWPRHANLE